jgi:hypothetical protein
LRGSLHKKVLANTSYSVPTRSAGLLYFPGEFLSFDYDENYRLYLTNDKQELEHNGSDERRLHPVGDLSLVPIH